MRTLRKAERTYLDGAVVLIDTREQRPLSFRHESRRATLATGDYGIQGPDGQAFNIAIERKSLDDLIGSLCQGRERFEREFQRADELDYFALVIEASLSDIATGEYSSQMDPGAVIQTLISWSVRYGVPVWLADSRSYAARMIESLLEKHVRRLLIEGRVSLPVCTGVKSHERPQEARKRPGP